MVARSSKAYTHHGIVIIFTSLDYSYDWSHWHCNYASICMDAHNKITHNYMPESQLLYDWENGLDMEAVFVFFMARADLVSKSGWGN
jgi:hypothetical protein